MAETAEQHQRHLTADERAQLVDADRDLADAVAVYEQRADRAPAADQPAAVIHEEGLRRAQQRVQEAEDRLWQLRESLLGWTRPPWAPSATLTADWFSDEDRIYDEPEPKAP